LENDYSQLPSKKEIQEISVGFKLNFVGNFEGIDS
jgi:hypothetical protein